MAYHPFRNLGLKFLSTLVASLLWLIVAGLAMHGIYDFFHGHFFTNPGVPAWWPEFCLAYDVMVAIYLAVRLLPEYPFRAMKTER